jgi:sugar phosphate isomerase/epimerase
LVGFETIFSHVGFHSVYEKNIREAVDVASKHKFSSVQIDATIPRFFPEAYDSRDRRTVRRYAEEKGVAIKVHAPSEDFSLQTLHTGVQKAVISRFKEVIDFGRDLGAKIVTIHAGAVPSFILPNMGHEPVDVDFPELHAIALKDALEYLSDYAKEKTLLCIENSPFTNTTMQVLSDIFNDDCELFLAWDLAKMYRSDGTIIIDVENFFVNHIDKVRECHLHDRTAEHNHQIIGQGYVDFRHYLSLLSEHPVEYTIEVRPVENAVKSFTALRKIITNKI